MITVDLKSVSCRKLLSWKDKLEYHVPPAREKNDLFEKILIKTS